MANSSRVPRPSSHLLPSAVCYIIEQGGYDLHRQATRKANGIPTQCCVAGNDAQEYSNREVMTLSLLFHLCCCMEITINCFWPPCRFSLFGIFWIQFLCFPLLQSLHLVTWINLMNFITVKPVYVLSLLQWVNSVHTQFTLQEGWSNNIEINITRRTSSNLCHILQACNHLCCLKGLLNVHRCNRWTSVDRSYTQMNLSVLNRRVTSKSARGMR
jgi:hypothetical protein